MADPAFWYFDVISPYAYLALPRLEDVARYRPVTLRPVVFAGLLDHWGQLGPAEIAPKRRHIYRHCAFLAARAGLPFRLPPVHPFNPLPILRLLTALDGHPAAVREAFHRVWGLGEDPSAPATLAAVARAGGDPSTVDRLGEAAVKNALLAARDEAIGRGVFGVPTLAVEGEVFWGVDAMDMALAWLADPTLFASPAFAHVGDVAIGARRGRFRD